MLVETVPNLSLGPQDEALDHVLSDVRAATTPGAALLDVHTDADHRRTVLTLAGAPAPVLRLTTALADALLEHASLAGHEGVHPRVGLLDVVPVVDLKAGTTEAAITIETLQARLAQRGIPVYRYARSARRPETRQLSTIRRHIRDPSGGGKPGLEPDAGPRNLHPTMGATCIGTRGILVAYNVLLDTTDEQLGASIAADIRASSGGLSGVQALAFPLESRGDLVQVSTNLTDVDNVGPADVYQEVEERARAAGVDVVGGELVGLAPRRALPQNPSRMGLRSRPESLEERLEAAGFELSAPV